MPSFDRTSNPPDTPRTGPANRDGTLAASAPEILSVSDLNRRARVLIEEHLATVWVEGEMSNFRRPGSGHWYFTLKDARAQTRCAMFANRNRLAALQPGDGQQVLIRGRVSLYEGRGEFQIIVDQIEAAGEGALRRAYDALKMRLEAEGLFDSQRKRPLPEWPRHVAVISSPTGAAIKDVLSVWQRRYPSLQVTLLPVAVQGDDAEPQILRALAQIAALAGTAMEPDILLLTRGGGSLEDLWAFNLESVARAVAACPIPTVSAIGHEIDFTITDFVADLRAPTPSAAAELTSRDSLALHREFATALRHAAQAFAYQQQVRTNRLAALRARVIDPAVWVEQQVLRTDDLADRLRRALTNTIHHKRVALAHAGHRLATQRPDRTLAAQKARLIELNTRLKRLWRSSATGRREHLTSVARTLAAAASPRRRIDSEAKKIAQLTVRMDVAWRSRHTGSKQTLEALKRTLDAINPLKILERGYAVLTNTSGTAVTATHQVNVGDRLTARLNDGTIGVQVTGPSPSGSRKTTVQKTQGSEPQEKLF